MGCRFTRNHASRILCCHLTWAVDSLITLPAEFKANTGRFGFCRDANNFYWVIRNGYVWKGRYNIDGWRKD